MINGNVIMLLRQLDIRDRMLDYMLHDPAIKDNKELLERKFHLSKIRNELEQTLNLDPGLKQWEDFTLQELLEIFGCLNEDS